MYLVFVGFAFLLPVFVRSKADYDTIKRYFFGGRAQSPAGIVGAVLAVTVLLWPKGNVAVVGDLVPALVLALDAAVLLMGRVRLSTTVEAAAVERATAILGNLQIPIGGLSFAVGVLHALISNLIFF